jgi:hypothetical protein
LEALNRRLAELSSIILERKNIINVLIQNHKRKLQVGFLGAVVPPLSRARFAFFG